MDLHFKTFGTGDPLIILHGLFGTSDNWQTLGKRFAEHYMVYLVDQRNHGRSPHDDAMDYPHMADDLRQFMQENWIHRAHILGHSMGGKTAMEFALRNPDMTDKLVVVDIAPKTYPPGHDLIFKALRSINPATLANRQEAEDALAKDIDDAGIRLFLLKNLAREKKGGFRWKMNLEGIYQNYEQILEKPTASDPFHGEALFIRGGKSGYIEPGDESLIEQWFPEARLETMNAGHWVHAEDPDGLYDLVHGFLSA
jgi:pimeloyl-ACP methyl ester carboxylesterase